MTNYHITTQARAALAKLHKEYDPSLDPKRVLLDTVSSAWRQRQVWEAMLAAVPEEDWALVGTPPIPGSPTSNRGTRIETMQRFLLEATKVAARTSKLAIDAGVEERLVRLAEEQSALIADTIRAGIIAGIGTLRLSPQAEAAAIEQAVGASAHHLRELAAVAGGSNTDANASDGSNASDEVIEGIARVVDSAESYP
jgi:hypothetical protein